MPQNNLTFAARKVNITINTDEFGGRTVTETGYDGRLLREESPNGLVQVSTYDTGGQVKRQEHRDKSDNVLKWTDMSMMPGDVSQSRPVHLIQAETLKACTLMTLPGMC